MANELPSASGTASSQDLKGNAIGSKEKKPRRAPIPDGIAVRYLVADNRYHFPDRTVAFVDQGSRLQVKTENSQVLKDLMAIAKSREWRQVIVSGSERFRRAAWAEATAQGLTVSGYTPSDIERQAQERGQSRREEPLRNDKTKDADGDPSRRVAEAGSADRDAKRQAIARAVRSAETTREELQLKFPEVSRAVFKTLEAHERFTEAYIKAGLIRDADRERVIAHMREDLASRIERGRAVQEPDSARVDRAIDHSVRAAAALVRSNGEPVALKTAVREESRSR